MTRDYACIRDGLIVNVVVINEPDEVPEGAHPTGLDADHDIFLSHDYIVPLGDLRQSCESIGIGWKADGTLPEG